ncbi:hypothetical protein N7523_001397 [Penicillium sp. IBT 18751x]|nr:hypothetical protein N7523_001397 [Penicillium sp. IBT 18751x]
MCSICSPVATVCLGTLLVNWEYHGGESKRFSAFCLNRMPISLGRYPRRKKKASLGSNEASQSASATLLPQQGSTHEKSLHYDISNITETEESAIHKTVFLGESSPLTCVVDEGRRSPDKGYACGIQKGRLHYSISELRGSTEPHDNSLIKSRKSLHDRLIRESALIFPLPAICDILLHAYFEWFHPCFPILDRSQVQGDYHENKLSPLLLQAILFIGVSMCSDTNLSVTGYEDRYKAKAAFYWRAKEIYDVGWEADTIIKLQSLFLLSFWRGGPTEERDVRFWLGAAIDLAQKKGMHVMSKLPFLSERDQKIWKRIWWALYVRDQQTSAALGLPSRIRDEDCEVEGLHVADFEDESSVTASEIFQRPPAAHISYVIGMAQLAKLLREVVTSQYLPGHSKLENPSRPLLHKRLSEWESQLPAEMQLQASTSQRVMFLVGMLHMAYNNLYILLYRPIFLQKPSESTSIEGNIALDAAIKSTRILEDMLSANLVQHGPVHLITHTFSALCIHTIHFARVANTARKLAEHRAKLCLIGLKELQKSWDLENWVLDLFFRCLDDNIARNLRLADVGMPFSRPPGQSANRSHASDSPGCSAPSNDTESSLALPGDEVHMPMAHMNSSLNATDDASASMDWYELFNVEGDNLSGFAGSLTNPDYLSSQNLDLLYRFL